MYNTTATNSLNAATDPMVIGLLPAIGFREVVGHSVTNMRYDELIDEKLSAGVSNRLDVCVCNVALTQLLNAPHNPGTATHALRHDLFAAETPFVHAEK